MNRTYITSWSGDGFGHQLMALLSCQAGALSQNRMSYLPSVHTRLEHDPPNATALLDFLSNFPAGRDAPSLPIPSVEKARFPDCLQISGVLVCDHCLGRSFGTVGCSVALPMPQHTHATLLQRVHVSLRAAFPGRSCKAAPAETLCVHWRQKAGWESKNWVKNRVLPTSTLATMIHAAQRNMTDSATVVVYTNADAADNRLPLPHVRSADENPLSILFEFTFCCDGIVLSNSALSAVIGFATNVPRSRIGGHTAQCLPVRQKREPMEQAAFGDG